MAINYHRCYFFLISCIVGIAKDTIHEYLPEAIPDEGITIIENVSLTRDLGNIQFPG